MRFGIFAVALALVACKKDDATPPAPAKPVDASAPAPVIDNVAPAVAFATHLFKGEYADALTLYAPEVAAKVKPEELAQIAADLGASGAPVEVHGAADPADPTWIRVDATFADGGLADDVFHVIDGKLYGMMAKPVYHPPAYVDPKAFTERAVVAGSGKTALGGILCLPAGPGPFPLVLLVQGSGGGDRDEWQPTVHEMLFRDLGEGLASRGVATLRFDKASFAFHWTLRGKTPTNSTIGDEYLDPVAAELAVASKLDGIDPKRVFVLGHSEGGWLVPWFLKDHPEVAGGIIASGNARHFATIGIDQDQYLLPINHPEVASADNLATLKAMDEAKAKRALDPALTDDTSPDQLPYGVGPTFWKSVAGYDAPAVAASLDKPMLLLNGGRDYNVTVELDHEVWKKALAGKKDVTAKVYPDLNHGYVTGKGKALPSEAQAPGFVAQPVVEDIAAWVKAH